MLRPTEASVHLYDEKEKARRRAEQEARELAAVIKVLKLRLCFGYDDIYLGRIQCNKSAEDYYLQKMSLE
jgi:hypothetical protein